MPCSEKREDTEKKSSAAEKEATGEGTGAEMSSPGARHVVSESSRQANQQANHGSDEKMGSGRVGGGRFTGGPQRLWWVLVYGK